MRGAAVLNVIRAYDDWIVRGYCWGRFWILRQRFLDEIGQYLPERGRVLDLGCGFGLFSLYYASVRPGLRLEGFDRNPRRIAMARAAARKLGLGNVRYEAGDVMDFRAGESFDAAYMLDIVHHIPEEAVRPLLEQVAKILPPAAGSSSRTWTAAPPTSDGSPTPSTRSWIRAPPCGTGRRRS